MEGSSLSFSTPPPLPSTRSVPLHPFRALSTPPLPRTPPPLVGWRARRRGGVEGGVWGGEPGGEGGVGGEGRGRGGWRKRGRRRGLHPSPLPVPYPSSPPPVPYSIVQQNWAAPIFLHYRVPLHPFRISPPLPFLHPTIYFDGYVVRNF